MSPARFESTRPQLFEAVPQPAAVLAIGPQSWLLRGYALPHVTALGCGLRGVLQQAPWRSLHTPGGRPMSVRTSCCGRWGWISDAQGYRYSENDPQTGQPWPALPAVFVELAHAAAAAAGYPDFQPDSCLINRYRAGDRMGLHQDRNERDLHAPIVSVSLGLSAVFLFGGLQRSCPRARHVLEHGDVLVWGGVDRLRFHGVLPVPAGRHPVAGAQRINLNLRQAA
jgi:alkylated DNA repair protein (DNA oxidative demethylase)